MFANTLGTSTGVAATFAFALPLVFALLFAFAFETNFLFSAASPRETVQV